MKNQKYLVFDYETFSEADIKRTGAWEYSVHPSTEILCVGFRLGTREELATKPTMLWVPGDAKAFGRKGDHPFPIFLSALRDPAVKLVAHNVFFERAVTHNVFAKKMMPSKPELLNIPVGRWICTAAGSRALGLPGSLELAGEALGIKHKKNMDGKKIMMKVCRPRKPTKKNPATRNAEAEDLEKLYQYCKDDTAAEVELFLTLPPLAPCERKFWELDQALNWRGFAVDRPLVNGALSLITRESRRLDGEVYALTNGKVNSARQRNAVLSFIASQGYHIGNLRGENVKELLAGDEIKGRARELLSIREAISRSSTAKYKAFEARSASDGRARDNLIYHKAHTGRDAGSGLQPQNLFKSVLPQVDVEAGLELIRRKDHHAIEALYEKPMDLYASAIRSAIIAAPGHTLEVGDFATIEVRVLFWLAGHKEGMQALASGVDLYCDMAAEIYRVPSSMIKDGYKAGDKKRTLERQVGKHTVLGAGFGIGVKGDKFQATCKKFGVHISLDLAQRAVKAYREHHPRVPIFWRTMEKAALSAMEKPGTRFRIGHVVWKREGKFLTVELPVGRKLHYYLPEVRMMQTMYGPKKTLTFVTNVNAGMRRVKTWGGELVQNCVQAVARDLLKESQLRLEARGHLNVLAVHDEAVSEVPLKKANLKEFESLMAEVPAWAEGLPVKVEGWAEPRYRK